MTKFYVTRNKTFNNEIIYYVNSSLGETYSFQISNLIKDNYYDKRKLATKFLKKWIAENFPEDFV